MGQSWQSVSAAAEGPQRTEAMINIQQEARNKESRWAETTPKRWKQLTGEDRTEMKIEAKTTEVHFAQWVDVEYREKGHEKI